MQSSRKEIQNSRNIPRVASTNPPITSVEDMFVAQLATTRGMRHNETASRGCGTEWTIDPQFGKGNYWYYPIEDSIALAVFDLLFYEDTSFEAEAPNFFCFGNYGYNMVPYFTPFIGVEEGWDRGTLLGYAWRKGIWSELIRAHTPLTVTSISLLPQGATMMANRLGCDPLTLTSAISSLNGDYRILPLHRIFEEIRETQPSKLVARAYYDSKITEACALLVDWWDSTIKHSEPRIRPADRTVLNVACAYIGDHLPETITLEDLCRVSCVSTSKLTSLFKDIEHVTPLQYVRDRRMEKACDLLTSTDDSLADIASQIGYQRQGSFSEAFKERFGMTPHQYRASNRPRHMRSMRQKTLV